MTTRPVSPAYGDGAAPIMTPRDPPGGSSLACSGHRKRSFAIRTASAALISVCLVGCGGDSASPAAPTSPPPSPPVDPPPAPPPAPVGWSLEGQVSDRATTDSLSGARVLVLDGDHAGREELTGEDGRYHFEGVAGDLNLLVVLDGYHELRAAVNVNQDRTLDFELESLPSGTAFDAGRRLVNNEIAPGRYFANPVRGCFWERLGATGGVIASEFLDFDADQEIVDIAASDHVFRSDADCRDWQPSPAASAPTGRIPGGRWLVGEQVEPGEYVTDANAGCYWARLRRFSGETRLDVIDNEFVAGGGRRTVVVSSTDVGFFSDASCGAWTRSGSGSGATEAHKTWSELDRNREMYRSHRGSH